MIDYLKYIIKRFTGYGTYINIDKVRAKVDAVVSEHGSLLNKTGFVYNTDKSSVWTLNSTMIEAHDYLKYYEFLFSQFRTEKFSLIEFGCLDGGSLRTWERYFSNAEIYGVDLDEEAKCHESERIHVVIGDATSQDTYDTLKKSIGNAFIILDDASHAWSDQRRSFELFWDMVSPGGFYVIEDLECGTLGAYPPYPPKVLDSQPFFDYMQDRSRILRWALNCSPETNSYHFDHLPPQIQKIELEMDMCIFIPGSVIVRKKA